ncbi:MAG TPA: helix-turn-helix transcriptional regulator [Polyangiaceae bacterium]|nr:helix-turn-helix transcriptional regulator [Polyangiaceae bacterium]
MQSELAAPLALDKLSMSVGRSKHFLVREFRRHYHCSPIRLQRALRLTEAARRLASGSPPVIVAAELGFADQAHLSRLFVATFSVSPGAYGRAPTTTALNDHLRAH